MVAKYRHRNENTCLTVEGMFFHIWYCVDVILIFIFCGCKQIVNLLYDCANDFPLYVDVQYSLENL